ncbi:MAG: hypothetical protein SOX53_01425 [Candidatus Onthovivens sp.]|nr:hypothetical protein [Candidatus Onthovivens sp.]
MRNKDYIKEINKEIDSHKNYEQISSKLQFKDQERVFNMKNRKLCAILCCSAAAVVLVGGVGLGVGLGLSQNKEGTPTSLVKMSVNPELSMVLDENNVVLSISGDNEEGKMLLVDEKVVGKEVDEAIEYIINIENETGYLVSGEFVSEPNKITIQISVNDENIKNSLNEVINKAIETTCDKLHIQETVEWAEDITHQNLVELAMKADPTLTSEEASKLTNEQLLDIIKLYQIETAEIYSVELEELYNQIKDYELQFTETEFVNETIKSLGKIYEIFTSTLQSSVNVLQDRIDDVNDIRYKTFVAPTSDYQKQIDEVNAKKEEVIAVRNEIANTEEDAIRKSKIAILNTKIAAYQACLEALENIKNSCLASIDLYIQSLKSAINSINDLIASLLSQDEVEATLKEKTVELEKKLNEAKTNFFTKFEDEYGEDIANAKQKALEYKESLKEKVSEARN